MKMIFLVDGDNNIGTGLQGVDLLTAEDSVLIFYGKGQSLANLQRLCANTRAQVQYLESVQGGKNSIDFQIITELGVLIGRGEADFAYVISQDKGYEAAMGALQARYAASFQEVGLRPTIQSCLQAAFWLRSATKEDLAATLIEEYGPVQGALTYRHLVSLFTPSKSRRAVQQRKRLAAKEVAPSEETEAPSTQAASGSEAEEDKARVNRGGRRRKR